MAKSHFERSELKRSHIERPLTDDEKTHHESQAGRNVGGESNTRAVRGAGVAETAPATPAPAAPASPATPPAPAPKTAPKRVRPPAKAARKAMRAKPKRRR